MLHTVTSQTEPEALAPNNTEAEPSDSENAEDDFLVKMGGVGSKKCAKISDSVQINR